MRDKPRSPQVPPDVLYRFQVEDSQTGERYFVLVGEDGMAYREQVTEPLRKVG